MLTDLLHVQGKLLLTAKIENQTQLRPNQTQVKLSLQYPYTTPTPLHNGYSQEQDRILAQVDPLPPCLTQLTALTFLAAKLNLDLPVRSTHLIFYKRQTLPWEHFYHRHQRK